jgi:hypothetical protein
MYKVEGEEFKYSKTNNEIICLFFICYGINLKKLVEGLENHHIL